MQLGTWSQTSVPRFIPCSCVMVVFIFSQKRKKLKNDDTLKAENDDNVIGKVSERSIHTSRHLLELNTVNLNQNTILQIGLSD